MPHKDKNIGSDKSNDKLREASYTQTIEYNGFNYFFLELSRAYTVAYALCYILSPFMGLQLSTIHPILNTAMLVGVGFGLLGCVVTGNKYLILIFAGGEAFFCAAHFLKILPWVPLFSDSAFLIMSALDLIQATFLFMQYQIVTRTSIR